jgi:hypothetical protein
MIKYIALIIFGTSLCLSSTSYAAIAYVRDVGLITANNVNSSNVSFGTAPAVGNHVFVQISGWCGAGFNVQNGDIVDNQGGGNTYNVDLVENPGFASTQASITSSHIASSSGTFTITVTPDNTADFFVWSASEFSGIATSNWLDKTGVFPTASTTTGTVTASGVNSQANELVLPVIVLDSNEDVALTGTATTGYATIYTYSDAATIIGGQGNYKIVTSPETSSATWTWNDPGIQGSALIIATYKSALGAADTTTVIRNATIRNASIP